MISANKALVLIRTEYKRLDRITGIDSSPISIRLSARLHRKLGYFSVEKEGFFAKPRLSIVISAAVLGDDSLFYDVIRHEYAHAVCFLRYPGCNHGHDKIWKSVCAEVGCIPRASRKIGSLSPSPASERPYRYTITCCGCGAVSKYKTESKVVRLAEGKLAGNILCRHCGSERFTLTKL